MENKEHRLEENAIYIKVNPTDLSYIDKIIEGFDGLGILSTINGKTGEAIVRVTPETKAEMVTILKSITKEITFL